MREIKAFASLSSGLLARKGAARPAMRPQLLGAAPVAAGAVDDLGWNDMGEDAAAPAHADMPPPAHIPAPAVVQQQEELRREFAPPPVATAPAATNVTMPARAGRRAAFTLRLDADRHLRLRLAAAAQHRSAQQIVTEALDAWLAQAPEAERLAAAAVAPN